MSRANEYVTVSVNIVRVLERSVLVENQEGDKVSIGRSCIFGPDESGLDDIDTPQEMELRVFSWLARKENLI